MFLRGISRVCKDHLMATEASYLVKARNATSGSLVKFRVRAPFSRDGAGNEIPDTDAIHAQIARTIGAHRPASGLWAYSVSYRGESFDDSEVSV